MDTKSITLAKLYLSHPGKIGDLFFALPTARALCNKYNRKADFFTSEYCRGAIPLIEYQSYINQVIVPEDYVITGYGEGVKPTQMPVPPGYEHVHHIGIARWPTVDMVSFYGELMNIEPCEYIIECPDEMPIDIDSKFILLCRGRGVPEYYWHAVIERFGNNYPIVQTGGLKEELYDGVVNDRLFSFIETATLLKHAAVFVSSLGANTVMSIAFPEVKSVIVLPKQGIDYRHNVHRPNVYYMTEPHVEEMLDIIKEGLS